MTSASVDIAERLYTAAVPFFCATIISFHRNKNEAELSRQISFFFCDYVTEIEL